MSPGVLNPGRRDRLEFRTDNTATKPSGKIQTLFPATDKKPHNMVATARLPRGRTLDDMAAITPEGTAIGYHGTRISAAQAILDEGFRISENQYDWLGDGVYFFQDAPQQAWDWALERYGDDAAVVGARIRTAECVNLLDTGWNSFMANVYNSYLSFLNRLGDQVPEQSGGNHRLDREVINYAVGVLEDSGYNVACIRAAFAEGRPVYPNSAILDLTHVQIAVRHPDRCLDDIWLETAPTESR